MPQAPDPIGLPALAPARNWRRPPQCPSPPADKGKEAPPEGRGHDHCPKLRPEPPPASRPSPPGGLRPTLTPGSTQRPTTSWPQQASPNESTSDRRAPTPGLRPGPTSPAPITPV